MRTSWGASTGYYLVAAKDGSRPSVLKLRNASPKISNGTHYMYFDTELDAHFVAKKYYHYHGDPYPFILQERADELWNQTALGIVSKTWDKIDESEKSVESQTMEFI